MTARTWLANDDRLQWVQTAENVIQLVAVDGGTCGTVTRNTDKQSFSGSTHRKYLGVFREAKDARAAVEQQFAIEQKDIKA